MRVGAGVLAVLVCAVACGGSSRRTGGSSGATRAGGSGTGGDSTTGGGKGSKPPASGGSGAVAAVGGTSSSVGGTSSSVGGRGSTAATGGRLSSGGTAGLGEGGDGNAGSGNAGVAGKPSAPITSCTESFPFLGTWEGSVLDFYFEPRQSLSLELFENADKETVGTLTWGGGEPPAPPTSGDEPWPPDYWPADGNGGRGAFNGASPDIFPGFPYTVVRGAGCDATLRFGIASTEPWQDWCALQTPVYTDGYGWSCILMGDGASGDGTECTTTANGQALATYPLWRCTACGAFGTRLCACDENGCRAADDEPTHVFDLARSTSGDSDVLSGKDATCPDCTVRLTRQSD